MFDPFEIKRLVLEALPDATVEVEDTTGGGDHFQVEVISSRFQGKTLLEQHRMIYRALGDAMNGPIHALQIKTKALNGNGDSFTVGGQRE